MANPATAGGTGSLGVPPESLIKQDCYRFSIRPVPDERNRHIILSKIKSLELLIEKFFRKFPCSIILITVLVTHLKKQQDPSLQTTTTSLYAPSI